MAVPPLVISCVTPVFPVKLKVPSPPTVFLTIFNDPRAVFVNTHVTASLSARFTETVPAGMFGVEPDVPAAEQEIPVRSQPVVPRISAKLYVPAARPA